MAFVASPRWVQLPAVPHLHVGPSNGGILVVVGLAGYRGIPPTPWLRSGAVFPAVLTT